jgi:hypothetical protein
MAYATSTVRKTIHHSRSKRRPQHVYIRMTDADRRAYNQIVGGFKHFMGAEATGADIFATYGIPAMKAALKRLADSCKGKSGGGE